MQALNELTQLNLSRVHILFLVLVCGLVSVSFSFSAHAARADLPTANEVSPGRRTQIDGIWRISTLNKRVRIDRGRAIAVDGWRHMLFWEVKPGMVVIEDIHRSDGVYKGYDLLLQGPWRASYDRHGRLDVMVNDSIGFQLFPADDDGDYEEEDDYREAPREEKDRFIAAIRRGNAKLPSIATCPGKQSYLSNGACWTCPNGYKRAKITREMNHHQACKSRKNKNKFTKATNITAKRARCPSGQFHVAERGINGCYICPKGSRRDKTTHNSTQCKVVS